MNNGGGTDQEVADATMPRSIPTTPAWSTACKAVTTRNVNRTYANYTPVQLQPRSTRLPPRCDPAGVIADINDTVTLAAMRSLQDKTTAEIKPLSIILCRRPARPSDTADKLE